MCNLTFAFGNNTNWFCDTFFPLNVLWVKLCSPALKYYFLCLQCRTLVSVPGYWGEKGWTNRLNDSRYEIGTSSFLLIGAELWKHISVQCTGYLGQTSDFSPHVLLFTGERKAQKYPIFNMCYFLLLIMGCFLSKITFPFTLSLLVVSGSHGMGI